MYRATPILAFILGFQNDGDWLRMRLAFAHEEACKEGRRSLANPLIILAFRRR